MKVVAAWLKYSFTAGRQLGGIIYVHRISDVRISGSSMLNFGVFQKMTGAACSKNIVLATTLWDCVDEETGIQRQAELQTVPDFWGSSCQEGSRVVRLSDTNAIKQLLKSMTNNTPMPLRIQDEMAVHNVSSFQTSAGIALQSEDLHNLRKKHSFKLTELRSHMTKYIATANAQMAKEIETRHTNEERALKE